MSPAVSEPRKVMSDLSADGEEGPEDGTSWPVPTPMTTLVKPKAVWSCSNVMMQAEMNHGGGETVQS